MTFHPSSKTTSLHGDDLPPDLHLHLLTIGVLEKPKPKQLPPPTAQYVAWKPKNRGDEPPF